MKRSKILTLLLVGSVVGTLISCQSTELAAGKVEQLDLSGTREDFNIIPDDSVEVYSSTMKNVVEPKLEQIRHKGTFSSNHNGHRIYYENYDVKNEKGSVVLLHGFTEFIKKYNEIIYYFTEAGYDVYMMEHFGHGYSERSEAIDGNLSKVAVEEFNIYVDDAFQFVTDVVNKKRDKNKPLILYGHSMGGGIATRVLETYPGHFDAAVLSSPMLEINTGATPEWIARFVAGSAKFFGAGGNYIFGHSDFSTEEAFDDPGCAASSYPRYKYALSLRNDDEYMQMNGATWYWLDAAIDATHEAVKESEAQKVTIPVLMFQAEKDSLVESRGQLKFAETVPNIRVVFCPEAHHEVFNAPNEIANAYWVTIFDFLEGVDYGSDIRNN